MPIAVAQDSWVTWNSWVLNSTSTSTTITNSTYANGTGSWDAPWIAWHNTTSTGATIQLNPVAPPPRLTPEEEAERRQQVAARERRYQADRAERTRRHRERVHAEAARMDAAQEQALELLKMILPPEDLEVFETTGLIYCTGSEGTRFLIERAGYSGNVVALDQNGERLGGFCAHPVMVDSEGRTLPDADAWISQILSLRDDEVEFMNLANCHWGARPYPRDRAHRPLTQVIAA